MLTLVLAMMPFQAEPQEAGTKLTVSEGKLVSLEYTLKLDDQSVIDSNVGGAPLTYTQGSHRIVPGLEKALEGMAVGETKQVTVTPTDGYGALDPDALQEVDKALLPPDAVQVGTRLQGRTPDGRMVFPRVAEVKTDTVILDFNHPLAGKTLHFDVKILDIQQEQLQPQHQH
jgi:FKBP-type peptidyl-prolyl cis-trans isomerase SlyD